MLRKKKKKQKKKKKKKKKKKTKHKPKKPQKKKKKKQRYNGHLWHPEPLVVFFFFDFFSLLVWPEIIVHGPSLEQPAAWIRQGDTDQRPCNSIVPARKEKEFGTLIRIQLPQLWGPPLCKLSLSERRFFMQLSLRQTA